jgi:hypothetical protein
MRPPRATLGIAESLPLVFDAMDFQVALPAMSVLYGFSEHLVAPVCGARRNRSTEEGIETYSGERRSTWFATRSPAAPHTSIITPRQSRPRRNRTPGSQLPIRERQHRLPTASDGSDRLPDGILLHATASRGGVSGTRARHLDELG